MRPSVAGVAVLGGGVLVAALTASTTDVAHADRVDHRTVFRYTDRDITESSGLAVRGGLFFTVNDSGAGPVLYAVDPRSG
ncbi:MAG TPA: hypothetical protein VFG63_06375, partial [Nocardioidaceae bacterium]|nr:hypothetical protein [Nocardioidaceae bacterium]